MKEPLTNISTQRPTMTVGWPTNSRITEDLSRLRDTLRLERTSDGSFVAPEFKNALFRELRAQDIAQFLLDFATLQAGITGRDVLTEEKLRKSGNSEIYNPFDFKVREPSQMQLLIREEDKQKTPIDRSERLVTSYPEIAEKILKQCPALINESFLKSRIYVVRGKVEEILRSRVIKNATIALDIIKSGETARTNRLVPFGQPVIVSQPGLYIEGLRTQEKPWIDKKYDRRRLGKPEEISLLQDFIDFIRDKAKKADIPLIERKTLFEATLSNPWQ